MKLEYLHEGSPDCPLIRLYEFDRSEASRLKDVFSNLAKRTTSNISLDAQPFITAVNNCRLGLTRGEHDIGIKGSGEVFECVLTSEGWKAVEGLTEPFCETELAGFQWLNEDGDVSLLLSPKGTW